MVAPSAKSTPRSSRATITAAKKSDVAPSASSCGQIWGAVTPRVIELGEGSGKGKGSWKDVEIQNQTALSQKVTVLEKVGLVTDAKAPGKAISSGGKGKVRVKVGAREDPLPPSSLTLQLGSQEGERRVSIPVINGASAGATGGTEHSKQLN